MSDKISDIEKQTHISETGENKSEIKEKPSDQRVNLGNAFDKHPIRIVATVVVATVLFCGSVGIYLHNLVMDQKNAIIELKREEIEKLREEREETSAAPVIKEKTTQTSETSASPEVSSATIYSTLNNDQLKTMTLNTVHRLRIFAEEIYVAIEKAKEKYEAIESAKEKSARIDLITYLKPINREYQKRYESNFKVDNIILREELAKRLMDKSRTPKPYTSYTTYPWSAAWGVKYVADDLEKLAKLLPR